MLGEIDFSIFLRLVLSIETQSTWNFNFGYSGEVDMAVTCSDRKCQSSQNYNRGLTPQTTIDHFNVGNLCESHIDMSIGIWGISFYLFRKEFILQPGFMVSAERHLFFDAWTPDPNPGVASKDKHRANFEPCSCPANAKCPTLLGVSSTATITESANLRIFSKYAISWSYDLFDTDDPWVIYQNCVELPCSPKFQCDPVRFQCVAVQPNFGEYYSTCKERCVPSFNCDSNYNCVAVYNGQFPTVRGCKANCVAPPWYGCPCVAGTPCCACPQGPFPCPGSCYFKCKSPAGKDCCLGF